MNELEELAHALAHQADACYLTVINHQRMHAYSIIGGLATLEARLYSKNYGDIASLSQKAIKNCLTCIRSTASTGKCYKCSKEVIRGIEEEIRKARRAEWKDLLEEHRKDKRTAIARKSAEKTVKKAKPKKKKR